MAIPELRIPFEDPIIRPSDVTAESLSRLHDGGDDGDILAAAFGPGPDEPRPHGGSRGSDRALFEEVMAGPAEAEKIDIVDELLMAGPRAPPRMLGPRSGRER